MSGARTTLKGLLGTLIVCVIFLPLHDAKAGSGFYVGGEFGFFDFINAPLPNGIDQGGYTFGWKAGGYLISTGLALSVDVSGEFGLVGGDDRKWFLEVPTLGVGIGAGFDAFMNSPAQTESYS